MSTPAEALNPSSLLVMALLATAISVAAVLVALDARERGKSKEACVLWFLGIQFFFPIIFLYLFFRNTRAGLTIGKPEAASASMVCPYCDKEYDQGEKICSGCGRLL